MKRRTGKKYNRPNQLLNSTIVDRAKSFCCELHCEGSINSEILKFKCLSSACPNNFVSSTGKYIKKLQLLTLFTLEVSDLFFTDV